MPDVTPMEETAKWAREAAESRDGDADGMFEKAGGNGGEGIERERGR